MNWIAKLALAATCALTASAALAAERKGLCTFVVNGKSQIGEKCRVEVDADGSFRVWDDVHTVYVDVTGDAAEASWNGIPKSQKADTHTGTLTRDGVCWRNATTELCVRDAPRRK